VAVGGELEFIVSEINNRYYLNFVWFFVFSQSVVDFMFLKFNLKNKKRDYHLVAGPNKFATKMFTGVGASL
jgi:hypothetical protein